MRSLKIVVIAAGVLVVILLILTLVISALRPRTSATPVPLSPSPSLGRRSLSEGGSPATLTSYKGTPIPTIFYTQAAAEYSRIPTAQANAYAITTIKSFYAYRDALQENKLLTAPLPTDFKTLELQVPQLKARVEANLLSSADFAYIKARFRYHPHASVVKYQLGDDLQTKAKAKIDFYRDLLARKTASPPEIVRQANNDTELLLLNNSEPNEYRTGYTAAGGLFFTDTGFHDFLFSQQTGVVSPVYTLHSGDNSDYAYLVVYPTTMTVKKYRTVADILVSKENLFGK